MSITQVYGLPGVRAAKTATHRLAFRGGWWPALLPTGKVIAGGCSRDPGNTGDIHTLRAGVLMGKIGTVVNSLGTVGYYAPSILGVTTNAEAVGSTSIEAAAGVVTELVRRAGATGTFKLIGPGSAAGAVVEETVTYSAASGTTITVTAIANNFVAGSFICPTDGSEEPLTLVPDGTGLRVTDVLDGTNLDVPFPEMPIGGVIDSAQILPAWPSDTSLRQWIVDRLSRASGGKFTFHHTY